MSRPPERLRAMIWRGSKHALPTAAVAVLLNVMVMLLAVRAALVHSAPVHPGISDIQEMVDMLVEEMHPPTSSDRRGWVFWPRSP